MVATIGKRFEGVGAEKQRRRTVANTVNLLLLSDKEMETYISGVILFDETGLPKDR